MSKAPICCGQPARYTSGTELYPKRKDLADKNFYICDTCKSSVGCHAAGTWHGDTVHEGDEPMGVMADAELRRHRIMMHGLFDPLWHNKFMTRKDAYVALAAELGIPVSKCHISWFTKEQVPQVMRAINEIWNSLGETYESSKRKWR